MLKYLSMLFHHDHFAGLDMPSDADDRDIFRWPLFSLPGLSIPVCFEISPGQVLVYQSFYFLSFQVEDLELNIEAWARLYLIVVEGLKGLDSWDKDH